MAPVFFVVSFFLRPFKESTRSIWPKAFQLIPIARLLSFWRYGMSWCSRASSSRTMPHDVFLHVDNSLQSNTTRVHASIHTVQARRPSNN